MQMLKKLFNSEGKYYLELDEAVETAKQAASAVQDKAAEALESKPVQQAVETAKQAADTAQDKLQSVVSTDVKTEAKSAAKSAKNKVESVATDAKTEAKSAAQKGDKSQANSKAQPSPQDAGASSFDPPFWVAAMYKNSSTNVNSDGTQAQQTFATDNLMPVVTKTRRRPGGSLKKFKEMASKAKTPKG